MTAGLSHPAERDRTGLAQRLLSIASMGATVAEDPRSRTCARCGRTGLNAFRPIMTDPEHMSWVCVHVEPCVARMRTRHRSVARASAGRPPTSPIAAAHLSERPACVIGSRRSNVDAIAELVEELTAADVDRLELTRRGLDMLSRRPYGLVILDAHVDDPVACMNQLARSLSAARHRDCAVVIRHDPEDARPGLEHVVQITSAIPINGPLDGSRLMAAVGEAGASAPFPVAAGDR